MKKLIFAIVMLVIWAPLCGLAQPASGAIGSGTEDNRNAGMKLRIDCFEQLVNDVIIGKAPSAQLDPFMMNADDIEYWMGQFEFTEDVLKEISREGFYNRIEGWAGTAQYNFTSMLSNSDGFEIVKHQFKYDDRPGLLINRTANLQVLIKVGEEAIGTMNLTMLDIKGQLKLIQAD